MTERSETPGMKRPRISLLAALALALVALTVGAACGNDDDVATTATAQSGKTAATVTVSPASGTGATSTAADKAGGDDFAALFARYKSAESRVDYNLVTTGAGAMT